MEFNVNGDYNLFAVIIIQNNDSLESTNSHLCTKN